MGALFFGLVLLGLVLGVWGMRSWPTSPKNPKPAELETSPKVPESTKRPQPEVAEPLEPAGPSSLPCPDVFEWDDSEHKHKIEYSSKDQCLWYYNRWIMKVTKISVKEFAPNHDGSRSELILLEGLVQPPKGYQGPSKCPCGVGWPAGTGGDDSVYKVLKRLA